MSYVPPTFANVGKQAKDLLTKKYDFSRSVSLKSSTSGDVDLTTKAVQSSKGGFVCSVTSKFRHSEHGTYETELSTDGTTKYSLETTKLHEGLKVKVSGNENLQGTAEFTYVQDSATATAKVVASKSQQAVEAALCVGFDGLTVGGSVAYDVSGQTVSDYNGAAQYEQPSFTASVRTANQADDVTVSYYHAVRPGFTFGASMSYNIASGERGFTAGGEYVLNPTTLVRAKGDHNGTVTAVYQHELFNPEVTARVTADFDANTASTVPQNFGLAFVFGRDF